MAEDSQPDSMDRTDAFQDYYPDDYAHCFGCGRLNEKGLKIKSYWDGKESVCRFLPNDCYTGGMKTILYGGIIASLIDCHGAGTAAAAKARELNIQVKSRSLPRFVTATLKVDYLAPTPVGVELELRGIAGFADGVGQGGGQRLEGRRALQHPASQAHPHPRTKSVNQIRFAFRMCENVLQYN